jgi:hypothetical protein
MCGIQPPSISTKLVLHVWNHNNYVPGIPDFFNVFSTKAYFKNLIMPPKVGWLCRYGNPFRGGTNPVVMYEAAIGSDKLATDIDDYREVFRPCIPCYSECSRYNCDSNCDPNQQLNVTFTLNDLDLQPNYQILEVSFSRKDIEEVWNIRYIIVMIPNMQNKLGGYTWWLNAAHFCQLAVVYIYRYAPVNL